jgi:predicted permease
MVSASFFSMVGASVQLGRTFTAEEDAEPNAHPVVVLSDRLWRSRFGADPTIVGRTLTLNDRSFAVVGVLMPGFNGLSFESDLWFPAAMVQANGGPADLTQRGNRWLAAVARIRDGVTVAQAQGDLDRVAAELAETYPETNLDRGVQLFTLRQNYVGAAEPILLAVMAGVGLLLLIACANVAGLQLVRFAARERELALRRAIGAAQSRLVRQLVVEGAVLAVLAAAFGLLIAKWGLAGLLLLVPEGTLPLYAAPAIDLRAFGFAFVVAMGCGLLFGLVPALRRERGSLAGTLQGSRGSNRAFGASRVGPQQLLVVAQTSFALLLLVAAAMFARSLQRELAVPLGFDADNVHFVRVTPPARYTPPLRLQFAQQLEERLGGIASVEAVTIASDIPLTGNTSAARLLHPEREEPIRYYRHSVDADFFDVLDIPIVEGRAFTAADDSGAPAVVAIGASAARRLWPSDSAVGQRLRFTDGSEAEVVGVIGDVRYRDLRTSLSTTEPDVYFPLAQRSAVANLAIAIRSELPSASLLGQVRREIAALDAGIAPSPLLPLTELAARQTVISRFASSVLAAFAATTRVLTAVGLFAVLAYRVSLRRREIGIRLALGTTPSAVMRNVMGHGLTLVAIGMTLGLVVSFFVTKVIASLLFGVAPYDVGVLVAVIAPLLTVAVLASWLPARRAARVDPMLALRDD